jgi:hypothetical protein
MRVLRVNLSTLTKRNLARMQTSTKSRIPKIIWGILLAISIIVFAWFEFPPVWFWIGFEVVSAILVAGGCIGELYLFHHPAGRQKREKNEHHKLESRFILAVAVGVTMELFALAHAIPQAVKVEKDVAEQKATNLSLSIELARLKQPREITPQQKSNFIFLTQKIFPKSNVALMTGPQNSEALSYAIWFRDMLGAAGFAPPEDETNALWGMQVYPGMMVYRTALSHTNIWYEIMFVVPSPTEPESEITYEYTNGFKRPIITNGTPNLAVATRQAFSSIFLQMGLTATNLVAPGLLGTNTWGIYVGPRAL